MEEWKGFLKRFGIAFAESREHPHENTLDMQQGTAGVSGYRGFLVSVSFDKEGRFVSIGGWE
jgi:hypothetical protein